MHNLYRCNAEDGDNIVEHIAKLKGWCGRINLMGDWRFQILDFSFKLILSHSLPQSWDPFTNAYVGSATFLDADPRKAITLQQFIGILKEEYECHEECKREASNVASPQANFANVRKPPLFHHITKIGQTSQANGKFCKLCKKPNHTTDECHHLGKTRCDICKKFGHSPDKCWYDQGKKWPQEGKIGEDRRKNIWCCFRKEQANEGEEREEVAFVSNVLENKKDVLNDDEEYYNFDVIDTENDERLIYYDCLADSATISHITNCQDIFTTYEKINNITIGRVGQKTARACGRGTVVLESHCTGHIYRIQLQNVLHVPKTKNNLISLGRWETNGRHYVGKQGKLNLIAQHGTCIAQGYKITNNLYKLCLYIPACKNSIQDHVEHTFATAPSPPNWETWHQRFGHISYSRLQQMHDLDLVEGFTVNTNSSKPNCVACTEAKQTVKPFNNDVIHNSELGELTHIDLWGKYPVVSIHGNIYYILMVDDSTRYITMEFLKLKSQAVKHIQNYLTYLSARNKNLRTIQVDCRSKFMNMELGQWCQEHGIEIQATAPYSPSQNGVAERMNCTLVELACAMLLGQKLPEFLWEPAVAHTAYLRNRSFTHTVPTTPYEQINKKKPDVAHLKEFGAPVWILLQGQKLPQKLLRKSHCKMFIGFDDRAKAVRYYNPDSHKVLTSRNFRFLTLDDKGSCDDEIVVAPDISREGELEGGT